MKTTLPLFQNAGVEVKNIDDILNLGVYITTAVCHDFGRYRTYDGVYQQKIGTGQKKVSLLSQLDRISR